MIRNSDIYEGQAEAEMKEKNWVGTVTTLKMNLLKCGSFS